jgi:shikimate dehydrogenase
LLKHPTLLGFNVTIPYKSEIIPFLDGLDAVTQKVGAVNCVVKQQGKWVGYNTDVIGFGETMQEGERAKEEKEKRRKGERGILRLF